MLVGMLLTGAPLAVAMLAGTMRTNVSLTWDYPTNAFDTNLVFKLYASTNLLLPHDQWPLLMTIDGTNRTAAIPNAQPEQFFFLTCSNYWGESDPSKVAGLPPLPRATDNNLRLGP